MKLAKEEIDKHYPDPVNCSSQREKYFETEKEREGEKKIKPCKRDNR